jgi:hypothetical protein
MAASDSGGDDAAERPALIAGTHTQSRPGTPRILSQRTRRSGLRRQTETMLSLVSARVYREPSRPGGVFG